MDWSLTIAIIALTVSVLSPVAVTWLNNRHQLKLKDIEFNKERKREAVEAYVSAAGRFIKYSDKTSIGNFGEHIGSIYLYVDESLWCHVDKINESLVQYLPDYKTADAELRALCKALNAKQNSFKL